MEKALGIALLSGGAGRRMGGADKAQLVYRGKSFGTQIVENLSTLSLPFFLSAGAGQDKRLLNCQTIADLPAGPPGRGEMGIGPMGGIWSCFQSTSLDGLFFVPCDMPLVRPVMAERLINHWEPQYDAVLWKTRDGRLQPLCGFYSRTCLPALKVCVQEGNYRMKDFLSRISCLVLETGREHVPDRWFLNVNDQNAYEALEGWSTPALAVSGAKNTGKTTLIEGLLRELSSRGIKAAVIKHDGHEFEADVPGRDSCRMKQAGAFGTVVYSGNRFSMVKDQTGLTAEDFFSCFPEADLILLEGLKDSPYPKVEVLRSCISQAPVCDPSTVLSYVTDGGWAPVTDKDVGKAPSPLSFEQTDELLELALGVADRSGRETKVQR